MQIDDSYTRHGVILTTAIWGVKVLSESRKARYDCRIARTCARGRDRETGDITALVFDSQRIISIQSRTFQPAPHLSILRSRL
jgi:hypothetical protein